MILVTKIFLRTITIIKYIFIILCLYLFFLVIYDLGIITGILLTLFVFPVYLILVVNFANSFGDWLFDREEHIYYEIMNENKSVLDDLKYSNAYKFYATVYDFLFIDNQRARYIILIHLKKYWYVYLTTISLSLGLLITIFLLII